MAEQAIDNQEWISRLTGNDAARNDAIEELTRILVRGLSKSLATRYGGGLQPEDIAQEALIKILASLESFEGRSKFTTWAMTIATRLGISELRRKRYSKRITRITETIESTVLTTIQAKIDVQMHRSAKEFDACLAGCVAATGDEPVA